ncbi:uncharacterized protein LOC126768776 isoform X2 [Nymphalis io]|uniref:uncharacterized protein LOC126768776 isoform X2 n=1 Tax=Inachis io TaxID=171585 RepID=UPI00216A2D93|nr:uncharacterized protein LOC126768776 isoform X2 [Nymphalis io]
MGDRWVLFFYVIITSYIQVNHGCSIDGIPNWLLPQNIRILDSDSGIIYRKSTTGIEAINSVTHRTEGLNGGPYVNVSLVDSELTISTRDNYKTYEDIETAQSIGFTANFRCADGSSRNLVFSIDITDTNNNDPVFKPSNSYELTLAPPVPPNFLLTNCISDIIVRDIDLTTERIDFTLEGSQLFEIAYDNSSTIPKEFKATLRTTTFIRSIPEAIILTITATDVDRTGDPRRTATATVKVLADSQFELPDEPIFSQPFYMANYTKEHEFILQDSIYLRQGYDSEVKFSLDGQFSENFKLVASGNQITFTVTTLLPEESFQQREIYLTVIAQREYTSGANAMIVLLLPEARALSFEKPLYSGTLEGYIVAHESIILSIGNYSDVTFNLKGQYEEYFAVKSTQNTVLLELQKEVSENIIKKNNFIALNLVASGINAITTSTAIFLEIIKPDYETPVFSQKIYNGLYSNDSKVNFQDISLFQGFDETVMFELVGDHAKYFSMETTNNNIVLALNSTIPEDLIFNEKVLLFNIVAEKPRTVGANTAVALKFPEELTEPTILKFTKNTYNGVLKNGKLTVEDIILKSGFTSQTNFTLNGDFNQDFTISNTNNVVTIAISNSESVEEIEKNKFVVLEIEATGERAVAVTTSVIIDIPKIVIEYPVFEKSFYRGSYTKDGGLEFTEEISLRQGYDSSVQFSLEGESSQWFSLIQNEMLVKLISNETNPLPDDLIDKNSHLLFTIVADKLGTIGGRAAIHVEFPKETEDPIVLQFEKREYIGRIENESLQLDKIRLLNVRVSSVALNLTGEFASYFRIKEQSDSVTIELLDIPKELLENNNFFVLNMEASHPNAFKGHTTIILDIVRSRESQLSPIFEQAYYVGEYSNHEGLILSNKIKLSQGFDKTVSFELKGDSSQWFDLLQKEENSFTLSVKNDNLNEVTNQFPLIFTIVAHKTGSKSARATIIITFKGSETEATFSKVLYNGILEDGVVSHEPITISGYDGTDIQIIGDYESSFEVNFSNSVVTIRKAPSAVFPVGLTHVALTLRAGRASAVLLLDVTDSGSEIEATFSKVLYNGRLEDGAVSHETITITGYKGTSVQIIGAYESSFEVSFSNGIVTIRRAASAVFPVGLTHIALTLQAGRASAVLLLDITHSGSEREATFNKVLYSGRIENGVVSHDTITIAGFDGTTIQIIGAYASSFEVELVNGIVTIRKAASAVFPVGLTHIALTLQAGRANAVLLLDVTDSGSEIEAAFSKILYNGNLENGVLSHETITIIGYHGTNVQIIGAYESLFEVNLTNGVVTVRKAASAMLPVGVTHIALTLQAGRASAVLLLDVTNNGSEIGVTFSKVLYNGNLKNGVLSHETITVFGYDGTSVQIVGAYESSFEVEFANGIVTIRKAASAVFPVGVTHIALTLQAGRASAVLLIDVTNSGDTDLPAVTFSRTSYFLWADINQTGVVGKVQATAENGERILYSLQVDDDNNLRERISINNEGEILLSAAVQSGIYSFIVTATAENSRVNATASVLLRVEALRDCGSDIGLPPLIVLEKPEEEPHKNLVILNQTEYKDCRYNILNSWPADQSWLYVDEEGLHAKAIDREHESIAFMTLSQIQVELILQCDSDEVSVAKRSLNTERLQLGPDEYGSNKWILADTIVYDARRSFVNLIVNDINDNKPIFIGNVNETIYVGFPVTELEDVILPRALTELKATDADVGENAALIYWSTEDNLAVAPKTGFVHVRNTARLENNSRLTVYATDLNGKGLTGTLDIVVKLLNKNQIAVITVRNAFLDDEDSVLNDLSEAIGYEIKVLRTVVISENNEDSSRKRRDVESSSGASLQLYVYGLQESEPVDVLRLTSDINNSEVVSVNVARVLSLEDHLEGLEICTIPGRDTVLFVTTIVLAVLLLIVIVVIFVWFILIKKFQIHLKWRKKQNYDQFNDTNSLESRNSAMEPIPKVEIQSKPRLNIEELKRSERRLQEMLDTPIQEIQSVEPVNAVNDVTNEFQVETILDIPNPISPLPIVIQSIDKLKTDNDGSDDEDEFGEKKEKPRKSVVTFNENVEKIIHLEDNYEDRSEPDLEVYKF